MIAWLTKTVNNPYVSLIYISISNFHIAKHMIKKLRPIPIAKLASGLPECAGVGKSLEKKPLSLPCEKEENSSPLWINTLFNV